MLASSDEGQQRGAEFELFLTHAFSNAGILDVREALIPGRSQTSDYRLTSETSPVYVEARSSYLSGRGPSARAESLSAVVRKKLAKFGNQAIPVVVAIDSHREPISTALHEALLGTRSFLLPTVGRDAWRAHTRDGIFTALRSGKTIRTTLSAVMVHSISHSDQGCTHELLILHNPNAAMPLPFTFLPDVPQVKFAPDFYHIPEPLPEDVLQDLNKQLKTPLYNSGPQQVWHEGWRGSPPSWWRS
jgi:hypothetical protein